MTRSALVALMALLVAGTTGCHSLSHSKLACISPICGKGSHQKAGCTSGACQKGAHQKVSLQKAACRGGHCHTGGCVGGNCHHAWGHYPGHGYGPGAGYGHHGYMPPPPHYSGYAAQPGPISATVAYPYYTIRGPRDFLRDNPPTIGP